MRTGIKVGRGTGRAGDGEEKEQLIDSRNLYPASKGTIDSCVLSVIQKEQKSY